MAQNYRLQAREVADSCVNRFLLRHGSQLDTLNPEAQLFFGDRVRAWRQKLEDVLTEHLGEHEGILEASQVPNLIASVGSP